MTDHDEWVACKAGLIDYANAHVAAMEYMTQQEADRYLRALIADKDVVLGLYQDVRVPDGIAMFTIKGADPFLTLVLGKATPDLLRWTGVHVADLATARAMHEDFFPSVH
jgi:hypothetical protein